MTELLLTTAEAAQYTNFTLGALKTMRATGKGPRFYKLGYFVRYRREDLDYWLKTREIPATIDWTPEMVAIAAGMKRAGLPTKTIAARLGVTKDAVQSKMSRTKVRRNLLGKPGLGIKSSNKNWIDRDDHVYEIDKEQ